MNQLNIKEMKGLRWLLLLVSVGYSTIVYSQVNKFEVGIEGGVSSVFLRGNKFAEFSEYDIREVYGGYVKYNLTNSWSFKVGVLKERKGDKTELTIVNMDDVFDELQIDIPVDTYFDYITIPILAQFTFGNSIKGFINIGPYLGYLSKQTIEYGPHILNPNVYVEDYTVNFKKQDWGITSGIGSSIDVTRNLRFTLEIRHNLGLTNVSRKPVVDDGEIQTNSTNVLLGMAYSIGRKFK